MYLSSQIFLLTVALSLLTGCDRRPADPGSEVWADMIFFGEHIVTMEEESAKTEAVAVKDGSIIFAGSEVTARTYAGPKTRVVELGEHALLPGFIDAHGHFTGTARFINLANLSSPPVGEITNISNLLESLRNYASRSEQSPEWIIGYGYDDSLLAEKRHPTRDDLDQVSDKIPITIIHVSHHFASVNSVALKTLGITAQTEDPEGGLIRRRPKSQIPNGVLEEKAAYRAFYPLSNISSAQFEQSLRKTADYYASYGITTVQDGASSPQDLASLRAIASKKRLPVDLNLYQVIAATEPESIAQFAAEKNYTDGVRLAGAKFILDGSPQGRTAWLTRPYEVRDAFPQKNYTAYATIDENFYRSAVQTLLTNNVQVLSHANGDAAIDLMLGSLEAVVKSRPSLDHRSVIIHAQLMRQDQIQRARLLNAIPSFFSAHPFFWGDWHRLNFGDVRARNISPARWAENISLPFTIHNDSPVVPPNIMHLLWVTTNRKTRSGYVLGDDQRLSILEALRAVTINAAYQNFEESSKGSIRSGKQADLVILDQNPLLADSNRLNEIKVVETIAHGKTIYSMAQK